MVQWCVFLYVADGDDREDDWPTWPNPVDVLPRDNVGHKVGEWVWREGSEDAGNPAAKVAHTTWVNVLVKVNHWVWEEGAALPHMS